MNKLQHWWDFQKPMQLVGEKPFKTSSSYDQNERIEISNKNSEQTFHSNVITRNRDKSKVILVYRTVLNCPSFLNQWSMIENLIMCFSMIGPEKHERI